MKIVVLMSTYNGELYVGEQLESILKQSYKNMEIIIRDDGSTDGTVKILKKYQEKFSNIKIIEGKNIGVSQSFIELLKYDSNADYYAFCDQDDIWKENKIEKAIEKINTYNTIPTYYYSEVTAVNNSLEILFKSNYIGIDTLGSSFNTTPAIGCTVVINKKLRDLITLSRIPDDIVMHDLYIYRVCLAVNGKIVHDKDSYILYRQHENNVVGITNSVFKKIKVYNKFNKTRRVMAQNIIDIYSNRISKENYEILLKIAQFNDNMKLKNKIDYICDKRFKSCKLKSDLKFIYDVLKNNI